MTGLAGRRIMVVEDNYLLATELKSILQDAGAEVVGPFATSGDAQRSLERQAPHCAVLDVNLGSGASFDLARSLRTLGTPFLFFTGYDQRAIPSEFADVTRLEKPVRAERLLRVVEGCAGPAPVPG